MATTQSERMQIAARFATVEQLITTIPDEQVADGYLFKFWGPLLPGKTYYFILMLRRLWLDYRKATQLNAQWEWPTREELAKAIGVGESTLSKWIKASRMTDADVAAFLQEEADKDAESLRVSKDGKPLGRARERDIGIIYLRYFLHVTTGRRLHLPDGRWDQEPNTYTIEFSTPMIPQHQAIFATLTAEEQRQVLASRSIQDLEDVLLYFADRVPESEIHPPVGEDPSASPGSEIQSPVQSVPEGEFQPPVQREVVHVLSTPLSTGYPQQPSEIQPLYRPRNSPARRSSEEEDLYYGSEDLPEDALEAHLSKALWVMFNPYGLQGPSIKRILRPRSMKGLCRTVVSIFLEAETTPGEAELVAQRVYKRIRDAVQRGDPIGNPSSDYLVSLRRELGLPDYPPGRPADEE